MLFNFSTRLIGITGTAAIEWSLAPEFVVVQEHPEEINLEEIINTNMKKNNLIINGVACNLLFKLLHRMSFHCENTIVIFGSIRSDPIWLMDILSSLDGKLQVFEPLQPNYFSQVKQYVPHWNHIFWPVSALARQLEELRCQISGLRAYPSC